MNLTIDSGKPKRLLTGGKYCPEDVVVTAVGGSDNNEIENSLLARTITEYVNHEVTVIGDGTFNRCSNLTKLSCHNVQQVKWSACQYCSGLTDIDLPSATYIGINSFSSCHELTELVLPVAETIDGSAFGDCRSLVKVDLPNAKTINGMVFRLNREMKVLILRRTDTVCTLSNTNSFESTPFAADGTGSGGILVVPEILMEAYRNATNWSVLNCEVVKLEGSEYE